MRHAALLASLSLLAGCCFGGGGSTDDLPPPPDDVIAGGGDEVFAYGTLTRLQNIPAPAALRAPFPATLAALSGWPEADVPPRDQTVSRVCRGAPAGVDAWLDAAASAAASAAPVAVGAGYSDLVRYCSGPLCGELRGRADAESRPGARETLLVALGRCTAAEDEARMSADGVPALALLGWAGMRAFDGVLSDPIAERLPAAIEARLGEIDYGNDPGGEACRDMFHAVRFVGGRPAGVAALVAMHGRLTGGSADCLASLLREVNDPRAREIFVEACPRVMAAAACARLDAPPAPREAARVRTIDDEVRAYDFDPATLPASGVHRAAAIEALARCATSAGGFEATGCLVSLSEIARPRAVESARAWLAAHPDASADESETQRTLDRFPEADALPALLREVGLLPAGAAPRGVRAIEILENAGRAYMFDTETGMFPNHHDALLVELAALAPGSLPGVLFAEVVAGTPGGVDLGGGLIADSVDLGDGTFEGEEPEGNYLLRAWDGTTLYEGEAENLGDWYDVDAVVGLLNTLARERREQTRWLVLGTGGQEAIVVAGPEAGMRRLIDEGVIPRGAMGVSAAAQEAEDAILRQLGSGAFDDDGEE